MKVTASLALLLAGASAQTVIESSSFGLTPNSGSVTGWQRGGENFVPQVLSDRVILTPPYPGNTRGFIWSQSSVSQSEWYAELQFRATGPERGGGNLQLWYANNGQNTIGASSIYTVGPFDGLALVVDSHSGSGSGGTIRGFLNDGKTDFRTHQNVDGLVFGHCNYPYRNLGRPSILGLKQTNSFFEVSIDGKTCFSSNKVVLPAGNTFGLTAGTPENPDSFEVFKFVLQSGQTGVPAQQQQQQQQQGSQPNVVYRTVPVPGTANDAGANSQVSSAQFAELQSRIDSLATKGESQNAQLLQQSPTKDQLANLDARLQRIEQTLSSIQRDLEGKDYRGHFNQIHETLKSSHHTLAESLHGSLHRVITASTPRMGLFIFLVIAFQVVLAGSYVVYKRRRNNMPKKFL